MSSKLKENVNMNTVNAGSLLGRRSGEYSQPRSEYAGDKVRYTATSGRRMLAKPAVNNLMTGNPELVLAVGTELDVPRLQPNQVGALTRSWTRPLGSAGGPLELPYPGHLPTLGLIKRTRGVEDEAVEVVRKGKARYDKNPFAREGKSEQLLAAKEREREYRELTKGDKESLRVFEKGIQTRQNRAGVIRDINGIKASKKFELGAAGALTVAQQMQQDEAASKKKLNIFDQQDAKTLKHETLARIGFMPDTLAMPEEQEDTTTDALSAEEKPKAIEYLQKGREQKESVRDFVQNSRKILTSQIAINDKNEETERLREYIIMEKEKLEQAKKTFAEDSDKFHKYKKDLRDTTKDVQQQHERAVAEKNLKLAEIKSIEADIASQEMEIKRVEDNLLLCKQRKAFLDELAISAGKKSKEPSGQVKPGKPSQSSLSKGPKATKKETGGGFFMTSLNTGKAGKDLRQEEEGDELQQASQESFLGDTDMNIYFDKHGLLEHLANLEEDNLFKIHLV